MYEQHRIPSTLSDPETLARVKALMAAAGSASCMQALRTLDAAGHIRLKWLRNGGQLRLRQMRQRSNCVRWCRIHHRQGGQ